MGFAIRKAQKEDLPAIAKIFKEEYSEAPYNERWTDSGALKKITQYFENNKILVALDGTEVCGFLIYSTFLWFDGKRGMIDEICVSKRLQHSGIGKSLMEQVEKQFQKSGITKTELKTSDKAFAFKFYESLGFKPNGLVCMTKDLKQKF